MFYPIGLQVEPELEVKLLISWFKQSNRPSMLKIQLDHRCYKQKIHLNI